MPVEIYFKDLTREKQREVMEFYNVRNLNETNWDVFPLFVIDCEVG